MSIKTYEKGKSIQISKNFKTTEFDCDGKNCCQTTWIDEELVKKLQNIRDHFGRSVNVISGYSCQKNKKTTTPEHLKGQAADITVSGFTPKQVAQYAEKIGILGIGLYDSFVHIDTRE